MSEDPFIGYLYSLKHEDSGALAALRRACGQRLGESRNCQLFASVSTRPEDFLTATLAAQYSTDAIKAGNHHLVYPHSGSIGAAWAEYCKRSDPHPNTRRSQDPARFYPRRLEALRLGQTPENIPSIHERFRTLLDAEVEIDGTGELAYRLRGLVRMCVAAGVPIDVIQLAYDLRGWRAESRYVQERWARAFYGQPRQLADDRTQSLIPSESQANEDEEDDTNAD